MNTVDEFKTFGYTVIKNIIDANEAKKLYEYTLTRLSLGNLDDGQVPGSPSFYQDKEVVSLQKKLLPKIEEYIQFKLVPVFCYNRIYRTGAVLRMHKDSSRAEISATINLGQKGDIWDLWLVDYDENTRKVSLGPGDALLYFGNKLHNWRGKLVNTDLVSQIMFHYVDGKGKNVSAVKWEIVRKIRKRCRELFGIAY